MHLAVGNANEGGDVTAQIEQRVHFYRSLCAGKTGEVL
jgi:hypothetical protein